MRWLTLTVVGLVATAKKTKETLMDREAWQDALDEEVTWRIKKDADSGVRNAFFAWPRKSPLKHYGGDAFDLLRGTHALFLGNSVTRELVVTLHSLIQRPRERGPVDAVEVQEFDLPVAESSIWIAHGAASAEVTAGPEVLSKKCRAGEKALRFPAGVVNCCVAGVKATAQGVVLTYAFTSTPSEAPILKVLDAWSKESREHCAPKLKPDVAVLGLSTHITGTTAREFVAAVTRVALLRPEVAFIVVTAGHTRGTDVAKLGRHEADVLAAARGSPVIVAPVSVATAKGIERHALKHETGSSFHFGDAGRYFAAHVVLNAINATQLLREPAPTSKPTYPPGLWWKKATKNITGKH